MTARKRFIVKRMTKFVVFDNKTRTIFTNEYLSIQNADAQARAMNDEESARMREVANRMRSGS